MKTAICIVVKDSYFATRYCIENLLFKLNGANADLFICDDKTKIDYSELSKGIKIRTVRHLNPAKITESYNNLFRLSIEQKYDYTCIFPSDILVNDNWLNDLMFHAENISESGVCGIRKGRENVYLSPLLNHDHLINVWIEKSNFISGVTLFKTQLFDTIGGLDEKLNAEGFEQDEFCFRVSAIGKRNYYIPNQNSIKVGSSKRTEESAASFKESLQKMFETKEYKKELW